MTDNLPPGGNGTGQGQDEAGQPQPWFPPAGEPGGYGQPPPFDPGQAPPAEGYAQPPPGTGQPGGYGQQSYGQQGYGQQPGGYGPPSAPPSYPWQSQPQAPKPGVIPLRPLGVGEILDGAFTSIRRNPRATLGIAALLLTASAVITTTLSLILVHYVGTVNLPTPGQQLTTEQASRPASTGSPAGTGNRGTGRRAARASSPIPPGRASPKRRNRALSRCGRWASARSWTGHSRPSGAIPGPRSASPRCC